MLTPLTRRLALPALLGLLLATVPAAASAAPVGSPARPASQAGSAVRFVPTGSAVRPVSTAAGPASRPAGTPTAPAARSVNAAGGAAAVLADDQFFSVACPAVTSCLATGLADTPDGLDGVAAASWNGTAWQAQDPVIPSGSDPASVGLVSESCPAAQRCVAAGSYVTDQPDGHTLTLAELWTGSSWQQLNTRYPSSDDHFGGVSCPGTDDCIAVGGDRGFGGSKLPLAELWQGGAWTTMTTPSLGGTGYDTMFNSVSCTGTSWCMAVGSYNNAQQTQTYTLAEIWNGSTWTQVTAPGTGLNSVSCTSPSACLAVSGGTGQRWNGTAWSLLPTPPGAPETLASVSCRSTSDCLAVGNTAIGPSAPYTAVWTGSGWRRQTAPSPDPDATLADAVCPTASNCTGVGLSGDGEYGSGAFSMIANWNGTSWAASRMGTIDDLNAVSCATPSSCLAAGSYLTPGDRKVALAEREQPDGWQPASPEPPSAQGYGLSSISCLSATDCIALDGARSADGTTLSDHWNGTSWQQTTVPVGLKLNESAASVSCAGQVCIAVGGRTAAEWNGTSWRKLPAPVVPAGSTGPYLGGISCVSTDWCLAVGQYFTDPHGSYGIDQAEIWNGISWTLLDPPAGGDDSGLAAVSCVSQTSCLAVGTNFGPVTSFGLAWNGSTWKEAQAGGANDILNSVACATVTHCIAVGYLQQLSGYPDGQPVAENWSSGSWSADKVGVANAILSGVSCGGVVLCEAVGSYDDGQSLAVGWTGAHWTLQPTANP